MLYLNRSILLPYFPPHNDQFCITEPIDFSPTALKRGVGEQLINCGEICGEGSFRGFLGGIGLLSPISFLLLEELKMATPKGMGATREVREFPHMCRSAFKQGKLLRRERIF